jgi:hypothetical protein
MIKDITRDACRLLAADVDTALKAVAAKHGLNVTVGGGRFTTSSFAPKVEFVVPGDVGSSRKDEDAFKLLAGMYGLDPNCLGKTFTVGGESYRVDGLAPRRTKNCVKITRLRDDSKRVCSVAMLKMGKFAA